MKKITAYIVYGGSLNWYNATLIFENGWAAFGHLCSDPCFMPGDLWLNRSERQEALKAIGYEVELHPTIYAGSDHPDIQWLADKNKDPKNWEEMARAYEVLTDSREELPKVEIKESESSAGEGEGK